MTQTFFERKIKPILLYVGSIGAVAMSIAYIILMFVLVLGFKVDTDLTQAFTVAIVNAVVGFIIMQFLKIQGIDFARQLPKNVEILQKFNLKKEKKKVTHSMKYFWIRTVISDVILRALILAITTAGVIYLVIEGNNDYNILLLSIVNLIMFACFGLVSLVKAYDYFNDNYIPYIVENFKIELQKNELNQGDIQDVHIEEQSDRDNIQELGGTSSEE